MSEQILIAKVFNFGRICSEFHPNQACELRKAVSAEIPKDFTNMNLVKLGLALSQALEAA